MKAKQIGRVVILACAMLFGAHTAQAFYNPSAGHWVSRDPIEEQGGKNLFGFVVNNPISEYDILGQVSRNRYSLTEMQTMLKFSKDEFKRKLKALCPTRSYWWWQDRNNSLQCCSLENCHMQAELLTLDFSKYLETSFTTQYYRFGDVIAFSHSEPWGETINTRAHQAPYNGMIWLDHDKGFGMKCFGMQDLMNRRFRAVIKPWREKHKQCFKGADTGNHRDRNEASHHWFGIYSVFTLDITSIDVHVDPWFSAGGIISPASRSFGDAAYFDEVLW